MNACDVIAYTYDADYHCTECAIARFGEHPNSPSLYPWIAEGGIDSEGNAPQAVFGDSEWWSVDTPDAETLHCGTCGEVIAEVETVTQ